MTVAHDAPALIDLLGNVDQLRAADRISSIASPELIEAIRSFIGATRQKASCRPFGRSSPLRLSKSKRHPLIR